MQFCFFKQKTAYEMRISDWSSTCALPILRLPDGSQKLQSRSPSACMADADAFMNGAKRILVFSDAGGTGRSYHASLDHQNQQRRVHFLLEPGWRADRAVQGLGRTNRNNQAEPTIFRPVTTDRRGDRRFLTQIGRGACRARVGQDV